MSKKVIWQRPKKYNRYERKMRYKWKLERLADATSNYWFAPAYRVNAERRYTSDPEETLYIRRYYRAKHSPSISKYLKRLAARRVRNYYDEISNRAGYKRLFDYSLNPH